MRIGILVYLIFLLSACANNKNVYEFDYVFDHSKSIMLDESQLLVDKVVLGLDFTDSTMIDKNPSLMFNEDRFLIYSKFAESPILTFDKKGAFKGTIGRIGDGPGEYSVVNDVAINKVENNIEVLSNGGILQYTNQGTFLQKKGVEFPALSFILDDSLNYWFYVGNNSAFGNNKIVKSNAELENIETFFSQESNLLPVVESNFSKEGRFIFRESLNHDLYAIENQKLKLCYRIGFPSYELPADLHQLDRMKVVDVLHRLNYASIMRCFENDKYLFMNVFLFNAGEKFPKVYYWIINKDLNKELVLQIDTKIAFESYLFNPQYLSTDNKLYCLGYDLDTLESEVTFDEMRNPSIVSINLDAAFSN